MARKMGEGGIGRGKGVRGDLRIENGEWRIENGEWRKGWRFAIHPKPSPGDGGQRSVVAALHHVLRHQETDALHDLHLPHGFVMGAFTDTTPVKTPRLSRKTFAKCWRATLRRCRSSSGCNTAGAMQPLITARCRLEAEGLTRFCLMPRAPIIIRHLISPNRLSIPASRPPSKPALLTSVS